MIRYIIYEYEYDDLNWDDPINISVGVLELNLNLEYDLQSESISFYLKYPQESFQFLMMSKDSILRRYNEFLIFFAFALWTKNDLFIIILKENLFTTFSFDILSSDNTLNL